MRTLTVCAGLTLAVLALVASSAASAAPLGSGDVVAADAIPVQRVSPRSITLYPEELADLRGAYFLSNGAVLNVQGQGQKLVASIDGKRQIEVQALSRSLLAARDGSLRIDYQGAPQDGRVRVAYTPQ
ncbi:hypothetical protein [Massilia sp. TS11]|uniref:hypothetical protein n=1 Tax=Massilia sp. TS11 TaxID=2908003 RepID=UPI001EDA18E0|nr:hypothetical protein [Massilia sp. TS11]MCG2585737.1 hypothetical protein [Massilia sp. TS11]